MSLSRENKVHSISEINFPQEIYKSDIDDPSWICFYYADKLYFNDLEDFIRHLSYRNVLLVYSNKEEAEKAFTMVFPYQERLEDCPLWKIEDKERVIAETGEDNIVDLFFKVHVNFIGQYNDMVPYKKYIENSFNHTFYAGPNTYILLGFENTLRYWAFKYIAS